MTVFLAYVPALHKAYKQAFDAHGGKCEALYLIGPDIIAQYPHLAKDKRAFSDPEEAAVAIRSWKQFPRVEVIDAAGLVSLDADVIMPNEDIMRDLAAKHFAPERVTYVNTFFRHTSSGSTEERPINPDETISTDEADRRFIADANAMAQRSSDWWRQVGAIIVKDGKVVLSGYNQHLPSEYTPYIDGDPRADFKKGLNITLSLAQHAEAGLIARAAREGIALEGASIYVTTFPCPPCARLIAGSGIKECYYGEGYSMLDGEEILKGAGVKIIKVS